MRQDEQSAFADACKTHYTKPLYIHTHQNKQSAFAAACTIHYTITVYMSRLPEDEPSGLKLVEDIRKFKIQNMNLEKVYFVGLYCVIMLQCTVKKNIKYKIICARARVRVCEYRSRVTFQTRPSQQT